jgi:RNA polymerase-binding protein DksA
MPRAEGKTTAAEAAAEKAPAKSVAGEAAGKTPAKAVAAEKPAAKPAASKAAAPAKSGAAKPAAAKPAVAKPAAAKPAAAKAATVEGLTEVRAALVHEHARLSSERESLQAGLDEVIRDSASGSGDDQADSGAKTFGREQEQVLLDRVAEAMDQTERAMARVDEGSYGNCESCGQPIGAARLEAYPRATLCVSCKQREERR